MCPFVNKNDSRCANHWTLHNITQAFLHCADRYAVCPVYQRLLRERPYHVERHEPVAEPLLVAG